MRPQYDVILYGDARASLGVLALVLDVRLLGARITVVETVEAVGEAARTAALPRCAVIACKDTEAKRLRAFVQACGKLPTLHVRTVPVRSKAPTFASPCTASVPFSAMERVLKQVKMLCARTPGPRKQMAAERAA